MQKLTLTRVRERIGKKAYIRATGYASEPFDCAMASARAKGWRTYDVPCGHDVMLDMPERLAAIAGNPLIARVCLLPSDVSMFTLTPLPLVNEPLPLLSHFGPKWFEAGIGCWPSFLKTARHKLLVFS
jgi:hypothetical protein